MVMTPEEKERVSEENFNLMHYVAHGFVSTGIPYDDLVGIGSVGFVKALDKYDPDRNAKFSTYAIKCIQNEILAYIRKEKRTGLSTIPMEHILKDSGEGAPFTMQDIVSKEGEDTLIEDMLSLEDDIGLLMKHVKTLPDDERYIIENRFGLEGKDVKTQSLIGKELGMSQANISKIEANALQRLYYRLRGKINLENNAYYRDLDSNIYDD